MEHVRVTNINASNSAAATWSHDLSNLLDEASYFSEFAAIYSQCMISAVKVEWLPKIIPNTAANII